MKQDLLLFMDVIEHVEDDYRFLTGYVKALAPGTTVLITVPAFQFLWSSHDVFLEHYRRYSKRRLLDVVSTSGLVVDRARYFYGFIFPLVALARMVSRLRAQNRDREAASDLRRSSAFVNAALVCCHKVEQRILFPWNTIAGVTLFCLASKPE